MSLVDAKIVTIEPFVVVGYQYQANLKEIEEKGLGKKSLKRLKENISLVKNKKGDEVYLVQIYEMKPDFNPNVDRFTQLIGYKVLKAEDVPQGMSNHIVKGKKYVTATHKGLESEIHQTYDYLYGKWLNENPYNPLGYDFEVWDERYKPEEKNNEIDVYVALK
ncbi:GyrI-like domain-containing protein [Piscibacillus sp. B03]|uniref:GyrI-like domain-containing protein n=1 Tax=Piscibacillus sp. B03 TaxID=3457430 RepID=UPI003FCE30EC